MFYNMLNRTLMFVHKYAYIATGKKNFNTRKLKSRVNSDITKKHYCIVKIRILLFASDPLLTLSRINTYDLYHEKNIC